MAPLPLPPPRFVNAGAAPWKRLLCWMVGHDWAWEYAWSGAIARGTDYAEPACAHLSTCVRCVGRHADTVSTPGYWAALDPWGEDWNKTQPGYLPWRVLLSRYQRARRRGSCDLQ